MEGDGNDHTIGQRVEMILETRPLEATGALQGQVKVWYEVSYTGGNRCPTNETAITSAR
jgi:hypothetical protein